ncbi:MAG: hypothetical protein EA415_04685 [Sphaerobacteraceae bacterium]|nr:MAG: hypothetical protein EA415_04685 [Sphaerobacteraceae bacterium]
MSLAVDKPILNNPFREPTRYWLYQNDEPAIGTGRREAGYYVRDKSKASREQTTFLADETWVSLDLVNQIRSQVSRWRENGYSGVTAVTQRLLSHWTRDGRDRQLFFCQREAVETVIWLTETDAGRRMSHQVPPDNPNDPDYASLVRLGCKMATGSGKTVVMAMLIAWSVLNKVNSPNSRRYSDAILIVCPNLTVKERLGGAPKEIDGIEQDPARPLVPGAKGNYYESFDLVPGGLMPDLGRARMLITNWHIFELRDDSNSRGIVQRGAESDSAFCSRVLHDLGSRGNIMVLNDEAHHAHRPAPLPDEELDALAKADRDAIEEEQQNATVWVSGLDRINAVRGISRCIDLSATPFYISGSGHPEGQPFPWIVSDFGLVDAIESGIVKIPRVPVRDDTGRPEPHYFRLWQMIMERLSPKERGTGRSKPKPEAVLREADGALQQIAGLWRQTFDSFESNDYPVPPCMIVVCDNTSIAKVVSEYIADEGKAFPDYLQNGPNGEVTIHIDSKRLDEANREHGSGSRAVANEDLRRTVATVGKLGEPGESVRCVVSVSMLTEGWDAQNVTQILGIRAFQSQLLCEQVVGRGLRRLNYEFEFDEDGVPTNEEYVDVYGIPFEVIPVKKRESKPPPPVPPTTLVRGLDERKHLRIEFPRVEGYVVSVTDRITCDMDKVTPVKIDPNLEPTSTISRPQVGYQIGDPTLQGPGGLVTQTRSEFYRSIRMQQVEYEFARQITDVLLGQHEFEYRARHILFPQVLTIVRQFLQERVDYGSSEPQEIFVERYAQRVIERLTTAIRPADESGAATILPRIERFRPRGTTDEVYFRTSRECRDTVKSHISHVVLDTTTWESSVAYQLEASEHVESYARNDHLDLAIPYQFGGAQHDFLPDFVVKLTNGVHLLLEVKGQVRESDQQKHVAAERWCEAVTNWGKMGRWEFNMCKDIREVTDKLRSLAAI